MAATFVTEQLKYTKEQLGNHWENDFLARKIAESYKNKKGKNPFNEIELKVIEKDFTVFNLKKYKVR